MTPTEYQRGKYKSLLKEISALEPTSAKQEWKWSVKWGIFITVATVVADLVFELFSGSNVIDWLSSYKWGSIFIKVIFWTLFFYISDVRGIRSDLKSKRKELQKLEQKSPALKEGV